MMCGNGGWDVTHQGNTTLAYDARHENIRTLCALWHEHHHVALINVMVCDNVLCVYGRVGMGGDHYN